MTHKIDKNYRIICLLNGIDKIVKKIAAEIIAKRCKRLKLLYNSQFRSRKLREAINAITKLIAIVE